MQRRHQKVLEEAPAPKIAAALIAEVGERCAEACRQIGYCGVGTFEFLYENEAFYFIEMNTRLQVEHPVTEMTTGIDIVQQQIRVARGERLLLEQVDVRCHGHALECRINAENPSTFAPAPGLITGWQVPGGFGVRVDSHAGTGYRVLPYYDSMIAKLIVHGSTREDALARIRLALAEMRVEGIDTNLQLHREIVREEGFATGASTSITWSAGCRRGVRMGIGANLPIAGRAPRSVSALGTSAMLFEGRSAMSHGPATAHLERRVARPSAAGLARSARGRARHVQP
jgi:acetyl-CoA carboxylase biotin carboxylase subunit